MRLHFPGHEQNAAWYVSASRCSYIATRTPKPAEEGLQYQEPSSSRVAGQLCLDAPIANAQATTLGTLLSWASSLVAPKPCVMCEATGEETKCSACKGEGTTTCYCNDCDNEHERDCKACRGDGVVKRGSVRESKPSGADAPVCRECDGLGWTWLIAIEAGVSGTTVDLVNLIAVIVASEFDMAEPVMVGTAATVLDQRDSRGAQMLLLDGATWRIGLMPLFVDDVRDGKPVVRPEFSPTL